MTKLNQALDLFHEKKYEESLALFLEISKTKPSAEAWFNVATSAVLAGNTELGDEALALTLNLSEKEQSVEFLPQGMIKFYFLLALIDGGATEKAIGLINKFKDIFSELKITDDYFLQMRGLPFLGDFLEKTRPLYMILGKEWLRELAGNVDAEGKDLVEQYIKANF